MKSFLWKNIITCFGIPRTLIIKNGTQFKSSNIRDFYDMYKIKQSFSSLSYPQGNGQAKASNKVILDGLFLIIPLTSPPISSSPAKARSPSPLIVV